MTQKDKDLLLKDLCARLPYGVKIKTSYNKIDEPIELISINPRNESFAIGSNFTLTSGLSFDIYECKPYLLPLSSMTEEQWKELRNLIYEDFTLDEEFNEGLCYKTYGDILVWLDEKPINECYFIFDYFNKNHFDYRGLIEKSLALDATNLGIYE